jgi:predicted Zn-dependent protease
MRRLWSDANMKWFRGSLWVAVFVVFVGCTTVSETGRKQLILLSPAEEMQLGITSFNEVKKEVPVSKDPQANALVQKVGRRIAAVSGLTNAQWEFVVFESKEANAFCLPGGKVGVYTGILPITKDEAGLATVIGHEVAHAAKRHGAERLSYQMLLQTGGQLVGSAASVADPRWQGVATTVYGLGSNLGVALPHSRLQESEADHIGLLYMAQAGYDPESAIAFWERFAELDRKSGGGTPWFLKTHPGGEQRIQQLKEWLPEAKAQYRKQ